MLETRRLVSGGIITNYDCSSKCRHCSFASSPSWDKAYMSKDVAEGIFSFLRKSGCASVHIGGGEPLLRGEKIFPVLRSAMEHGVAIEYIETNASWFAGMAKAVDFLGRIREHRVGTLLISIDPFHNEYIPLGKIKALMAACEVSGMGVFPWRMEFWEELDALGDDKPHRIEEFERALGPDYLRGLIRRYGLNMRGRALQSFKGFLKSYALGDIIKESKPCAELDGVHHFHIDLYGNFVPELCAGLAMRYEDLAEGVTASKYPFLHALDTRGIAALLGLARDRGFAPKERYAGKCDLCFDVRDYLVREKGIDSPDLQPHGHYTMM